ncbi:hypothetical protein PYCC9005_005448 [Savitreella phatthalungensis]
MAITKVVLQGANGNVGKAVLAKLIEAGDFQITAITRKGNGASVQTASNVTVKEVDFADKSGLIDVLRGQDAVVSTGSVEPSNTKVYLDLAAAAAEAGVRRYIPSDFGSDYQNPRVAALPPFAPKKEVENLLKKLVAEHRDFSYTSIITGGFLDLLLDWRFFATPETKTSEYWDDGNHVFSLTRLPVVGQAVVQVLRHEEETKNQAIYIQDGPITQRGFVEALGGPEGWTITQRKTLEVEQESYAALKSGDHSKIMPAIFDLIRVSIFDPAVPNDFTDRSWNKRLGIPEYSTEQVKDLIRQHVSKA